MKISFTVAHVIPLCLNFNSFSSQSFQNRVYYPKYKNKIRYKTNRHFVSLGIQSGRHIQIKLK